MNLIEAILYIALLVLILQLIFSFFAIDRRIVGIIIVLVILFVFFGHRGRHFRLFGDRATPTLPLG